MIKAMRKVPAGTFLVPMILSMLIYFVLVAQRRRFSQVLEQTILSDCLFLLQELRLSYQGLGIS